MDSNKTSLFNDLRLKKPLIHHITNKVTINDCANVVLAIGGSPVMADAPEEVGDMVKQSQALVLNMGTLSESAYTAMIRAGRKANEMDIPIILDPVGVGATPFRKQKAKGLLSHLKMTIIRGNASEIATLIGEFTQTKGVDSGTVPYSSSELAVKAAKTLNSIVVVSGEIDYVSDGTQTIAIHNGTPLLQKVTGTGCMSTSLIASFSSVSHSFFEAACVGMSVMGIAGERAEEYAGPNKGLGTFRQKVMDEISQMNEHYWKECVRFEKVI